MFRVQVKPLVVAAVFAIGLPAHAAQFDNRSFEQGSLNGWEYIGDVSVQDAAALEVTPSHGQHAALLTNSGLGNSVGHYGSTSGVSTQSFLAWLGYSVPTPTPSVAPLAGIEGNSGLRQSVNLRAGDVVSFDWNIFGDGYFDRPFAWFFPAADPYSGGTYTTLIAPYKYPNAMTPWLGKCLDLSEYDSDPNCANSTGWQRYSVVAPADGSYILAFGVFNQMDPAWLSALWLDNFKINHVPEPGVLSLIGLVLAGLAFTRHKRGKPIFAAAIAALLMAGASGAEASIIYDWTGTCTLNCSGTAKATMYLDDSYVPGSTIPEGSTNLILRLDVFVPTNDQYPSFGYSFFDFYVFYRGVTLPAQSGAGDVSLWALLPNPSYDATVLDTFLDGTWTFEQAVPVYIDVGLETCAANLDSCAGNASRWVLRVPEPGVLTLLSLGLAGLAFTRRSKK